ncbi:MAG: Coenzyme F420 hydrogenase/dehydrogenase, beta subunit C-terminal domain [Sphaerochaetaceae bacterium]
MIIIRDKKLCAGCHACAESCPSQSISMCADSEGFSYPVVDMDTCTDCGRCEQICPILNLQHRTVGTEAYACLDRDVGNRLRSSSGGVFFHLAQQLLEQGGVVFGARFDVDSTVVHTCAHDVQELQALQGSKYVQSDVAGIYPQVRSYLRDRIPVLFSGTPCQVAGLKAYLGKDYPGLLCVDFICHGVPSPMVWKAYRDQLAMQAGSKVQQVSFRDKSTGWKGYSTCYTFENGNKCCLGHMDDRYMRMFLLDLILRPSCHACRFKAFNERCSDITLADFWGVGKVLSHMDDDKGTSLVLVHTPKGQEAFKAMQRVLDFHPVEVVSALRYNPAALASSVPNRYRSRFFKEFDTKRFDRLLYTYTSVLSWKFIRGAMGILLSKRPR